MACHHPFLAASLPELAVDPVRRDMNLRDTFRFCREVLGDQEFQDLRTLFLFNDIKNVVLLHFRAKQRQEDYQLPAYYSEDEYTECRADPLLALGFIRRWWENQASGVKEYPSLPHTDELTTFFYEDLDRITLNPFIRDWYRFERELRNFTVALTREGAGSDPAPRLIPAGIIYEDVRAGHKASVDAGRELGWPDSLRSLDGGLRQAELDREKVRWEWLDTQVGADTDGLPVILAHMVRLMSVERWEWMSPGHGQERLDSITDTMRRSIRFAVAFNGART